MFVKISIKFVSFDLSNVINDIFRFPTIESFMVSYSIILLT